MDTNLGLSSLPSLYSPSAKQKIVGSKSLIELKKEIKYLYVRVHSVENSIESIKSQIPSNLNKVLLHLSTDSQKCHKSAFFQLQETDASINENDISSKLKEIESRLNLEIDVSLKKSSTDFDQQISSLIKNNESKKDSIFGEFANSSSSNVHYTIKELEERFIKQKNKINEHLAAIKKSYESYKDQDFNQSIFNKYSNSIDLQNKQIKEIRAELSKIKELIHSYDANLNKDQIDMNKDLIDKISNQNSKILSFNKSFNTVQTTIQNLVSDFSSSLVTLNEYSQELGNRILEMSHLSTFLDEKSKEFEQKSQENDTKCQLIIQQISEISKSIDNNENVQELNNLSAEVRKVHEDIQKEVENIKKSIKKCKAVVENI